MDMEMTPLNKNFSKNWRKRSGYNRTSTTRRNKVVRYGAGKTKRSWRLRLAPKFKLASPLKLWYKFKNIYVNTMLRLAKSTNHFGEKRVPLIKEVHKKDYQRNEFENRLVFEIYKSMVASHECGYTPSKA